MNKSIIAGLSLLLAVGFASSAEKPLAEGAKGAITGTSSPNSVHAGLEILKKGGSAADAAMAASLAQVVECGGAYVSHAGILSMVYFDAATGKVHYLNACYNTAAAEKDPLSISRDKPSGRSALVPGFMAGVQAAHDKFGKLPRKDVFQPAIEMADQGMKVNPLLGRFLISRKAVLSRLPDTKQIFTKADGEFYKEGELFKQPALAKTLSNVAEKGASYMYEGDWAKEFVAAVQKEGGTITLDDMKAYRPTWEEPLRVKHRDHELALPGLSSSGGVAMAEAMQLLDLADLPKRGPISTTPESLFWLMQIGHCQVLSFLGNDTLKNFGGVDLTPNSRLKPETSAEIWKQMQAGKWAFSPMTGEPGEEPLGHSDGMVVVDQWGNVAAVTHSINTTLWGNTGLFVGGVSIPDSAAIQQDAVRRAGPGKRLPDPMCPLIVLRDGKPTLGSSAIGGGLHQKTLTMLACVLDYGMDPQSAAEAPTPLLPKFSASKPGAQVEKGQFPKKILDGVIALGQKVEELSPEQAAAFRGYWVGVAINPKSSTRSAVGTRMAPLPAIGEGY